MTFATTPAELISQIASLFNNDLGPVSLIILVAVALLFGPVIYKALTR